MSVVLDGSVVILTCVHRYRKVKGNDRFETKVRDLVCDGAVINVAA